MVAPGGIAVVGVGLGGCSRTEGACRIGVGLFACTVARVIVGVGVRFAEIGVILTDKLVLWNKGFLGSPTVEPSGLIKTLELLFRFSIN